MTRAPNLSSVVTEKTIGNEPAAFDDIVKKALDEISGPVPKGGLMQFKTKPEIMILLFVALPDGPEVNSITYRLNDPSNSYADLSETAIGLYGKPDFERTSLGFTPNNLPRLYWLASPPDAAHGAPGGAFLELAYSKSSGESEFHSGQITLQDGGARQKRRTREIEDAVRSEKRYFATQKFRPRFFIPDSDQYLSQLQSVADHIERPKKRGYQSYRKLLGCRYHIVASSQLYCAY